MKKRIVIVVVLTAAVAVGIWGWTARRPFAYAGTIEATQVDISPQLATTISSVTVHEGDPVAAGQEIIRLSGDDVRLAAQIAELDYRRAIELHRSGSMPQEAFDRARYKRDDAAVRQSWLSIVSPLDGVVLDRYHEPGEYVGIGTKLLTLADVAHPWAYIYVPQAVMSRLSIGMAVTGHVPELGARDFPGRVVHIRDEAEFTPKNVQTREERTRLVYGVKIDFTNDDRVLKPGMTIEVALPDAR